MIIIKQKSNNYILFLIIYSILLYSCNRSRLVDQTAFFTFECVERGNIEHLKTGHYSGLFIFNNQDTMHYNMGYILSSLSEPNIDVVYMPESISAINIDSTMLNENTILSSRKGLDKDKFKTQNVFFNRKAGLVYKYILPIDSNNINLLGLYIDSIKCTEYGVVQFNAFFQKPNSKYLNNYLKVLKSIKLKEAINIDSLKYSLYVN